MLLFFGLAWRSKEGFLYIACIDGIGCIYGRHTLPIEEAVVGITQRGMSESRC